MALDFCHLQDQEGLAGPNSLHGNVRGIVWEACAASLEATEAMEAPGALGVSLSTLKEISTQRGEPRPRRSLLAVPGRVSGTAGRPRGCLRRDAASAPRLAAGAESGEGFLGLLVYRIAIERLPADPGLSAGFGVSSLTRPQTHAEQAA